MHDMQLMRDVRNHKGVLRHTAGAKVSCSSYLKYMKRKPLKIHACDSVNVLAKKLKNLSKQSMPSVNWFILFNKQIRLASSNIIDSHFMPYSSNSVQ